MIALLLGALAALCWGMHDLCVRKMSQQADTAACMLVVLCVGCVCLAVLSVGTGTPLGIEQSWREEALSGCAFAVATYCLWRAFGAGSVRLVAPIVAAYPVVSLLLATSDGETVGMLEWLLVLTVIAGVVIVTRGERSNDDPGADTPSVLIPVAWAVAAAIAFAITFWLGQRAMESGETMPVLVVTRIFAVLTLLIFMLASGGLRLPARADLPILAVMGFLDTVALAVVLYAGRLPGGTYATVTASLFGVITILLAWALLRERLVPIQWVGVAVTFAAIGVLGAT